MKTEESRAPGRAEKHTESGIVTYCQEGQLKPERRKVSRPRVLESESNEKTAAIIKAKGERQKEKVKEKRLLEAFPPPALDRLKAAFRPS